MDQWRPFTKSRIAKIMDLANYDNGIKSNARVKTRLSPIEKHINCRVNALKVQQCSVSVHTNEHNASKTLIEAPCEDSTEINVNGAIIKEMQLENHIECPIIVSNTQHLPVSSQLNEHNVSKIHAATCEDGAETSANDTIEESLPEKLTECQLTDLNVQQNSELIQANEHASKNLLEELNFFHSSDDGDFGPSSRDDYICDTDESSFSTYVSRRQAKRRKTATSVRNNTTVPETLSPEHHRNNSNTPENAPGCSFWKDNGMNSNGKKKKIRKSEKERRAERVMRTLFRNSTQQNQER